MASLDVIGASVGMEVGVVKGDGTEFLSPVDIAGITVSVITLVVIAAAVGILSVDTEGWLVEDETMADPLAGKEVVDGGYMADAWWEEGVITGGAGSAAVERDALDVLISGVRGP